MNIAQVLLYIFLALVLLGMFIAVKRVIKGPTRKKRLKLAIISSLTTYIACTFGIIAVLGYNGTGNILELVWNFTGCVIPFVIIAGVGTYFKIGALGFD
jgi:multisubunit Na+/H+ antiporter MnhF subunit